MERRTSLALEMFCALLDDGDLDGHGGLKQVEERVSDKIFDRRHPQGVSTNPLMSIAREFRHP